MDDGSKGKLATSPLTLIKAGQKEPEATKGKKEEVVLRAGACGNAEPTKTEKPAIPAFANTTTARERCRKSPIGRAPKMKTKRTILRPCPINAE